VQNDGSGAASDPAEFQVELKSCGRPVRYTYTAQA